MTVDKTQGSPEFHQTNGIEKIPKKEKSSINKAAKTIAGEGKTEIAKSLEAINVKKGMPHPAEQKIADITRYTPTDQGRDCLNNARAGAWTVRNSSSQPGHAILSIKYSSNMYDHIDLGKDYYTMNLEERKKLIHDNYAANIQKNLGDGVKNAMDSLDVRGIASLGPLKNKVTPWLEARDKAHAKIRSITEEIPPAASLTLARSLLYRGNNQEQIPEYTKLFKDFKFHNDISMTAKLENVENESIELAKVLIREAVEGSDQAHLLQLINERKFDDVQVWVDAKLGWW